MDQFLLVRAFPTPFTCIDPTPLSLKTVLMTNLLQHNPVIQLIVCLAADPCLFASKEHQLVDTHTQFLANCTNSPVRGNSFLLIHWHRK